MKTNQDFEEVISRINAALPVHALWDGFWVHDYKRNNLVISGSQDRIYYRHFDLVFKKVIFFNVPERWGETAIETDNMLRIATKEEFQQQNPLFDPLGLPIIAIDIHLDIQRIWTKHTFYIIAEKVFLFKCPDSDNNPYQVYTDPVEDDDYPSLKNRVPANPSF